ncbi:hypothetical protein D3C75_1128320 [compost metagenome]
MALKLKYTSRSLFPLPITRQLMDWGLIVSRFIPWTSDSRQPVAYRISIKARCRTVTQASRSISSSAMVNALGSRFSSFGVLSLAEGSRGSSSSEVSQPKKDFSTDNFLPTVLIFR